MRCYKVSLSSLVSNLGPTLPYPPLFFLLPNPVPCLRPAPSSVSVPSTVPSLLPHLLSHWEEVQSGSRINVIPHCIMPPGDLCLDILDPSRPHRAPQRGVFSCPILLLLWKIPEIRRATLWWKSPNRGLIRGITAHISGPNRKTAWVMAT